MIVLGAGVLLIDAALMVAFAPRPLSELRRAGRGPAADRARGRPLDAGAPAARLPARPDPVRAARGVRVGRAHPPLRRAARSRPRRARGRCGDDRRPGARRARAVAQLRGARRERSSPGTSRRSTGRSATGRSTGRARAARCSTSKASRADYWKAQDLDLFNGTGWAEGYVQPTSAAAAAARPRDRRRQVRQTITVTLRAMRTRDVIGAGILAAPRASPEQPVPGATARAPGSRDLGPAARRQLPITTYSPQPTAAQLSAAGADYPEAALPGYRSIQLPPAPARWPAPEVAVSAVSLRHAPSRASASIYGGTGGDRCVRTIAVRPRVRARSAALRGMPRRRTRSCKRRDALPRARLQLQRDSAAEPATRSRAFLFNDKVGYCQQFAGAMALLLRMGGVPARVAAGFTHGHLRQVAQASTSSPTSTRTPGSRHGSRLRLGPLRPDAGVRARARRPRPAADAPRRRLRRRRPKAGPVRKAEPTPVDDPDQRSSSQQRRHRDRSDRRSARGPAVLLALVLRDHGPLQRARRRRAARRARARARTQPGARCGTA